LRRGGAPGFAWNGKRNRGVDLTKYGPYRTPVEIYEHFRKVLGGLPGYEEHSLGETRRGRRLYAWSVGEGAASVLYTAGCHAIEFIGVEQCAAIADELAGPRRGLLEKACVWFMPVLNPDGHYKVRELIRRRLCPLVKTNARRVDLNRNFPVGFHEPHKGGIMAGSHVKLINYHGPAPISEPESKALEKLVDLARPAFAMNLHSFGEKICFPPCHYKGRTADHELFEKIGGEMAALQPHPYKVCAENEMYLTYGDISDWMYEEKGIKPFLLEIGAFGMFASPPSSWWNIFAWTCPPDAAAATANNTAACVHLVEAAIENAAHSAS